ncbi:hypothetical protein TI05_01600 [Achromatium sp. WMS3]|nr:hypothetical protein TI05_01600 [Achromatium sp. WMS3]
MNLAIKKHAIVDKHNCVSIQLNELEPGQPVEIIVLSHVPYSQQTKEFADIKHNSNSPKYTATYRLGFMVNEISVPDDFDSMGRQEIMDLFSGNSP